VAATGVTKIADVARLAGRFKLTRQSSARWAPQIATYVEELDFNEDVSTRTSVSFVALGLSATYYILALPFQLSFTSVPRPADFVVSYAVDGITMACLAVEISLHLRRRKRHGSSQGAHGGLKKLVLLAITACPFDAALWAFPQAWFLVPYVRLVRLVHGEQLNAYLGLLDHALIFTYTKVKLVKLLIFTLFASNLFACAFYAVAVGERAAHYADAPWRPDDNVIHHNHTNPGFFSPEYLRTLYWSIISLTTVGHVDIIRERDIEAWELAFGIALSILAMIFYTYAVANATTIMLRADRNIDVYRGTLEKVERYLTRRGVSLELRKLIREHFRTSNPGEIDDTDRILMQLPRALRTDVMRNMNYCIIAPCYVFCGCDPTLIGSVCTLLNNEVFVPSQIVTREGDMMRQMWFLCSGTIFQPPSSTDESSFTRLSRRRSLSRSISTAFVATATSRAGRRRSMTRSGSDVAAATLMVIDKKGDAIGEAAFLFSQRQPVMLVSRTKTTCLVLQREAFNNLMSDEQPALALMRTNVIEALRKKSSENADSLLQKVKHRKHGLITDLLYCAASGDTAGVSAVLYDATYGVQVKVDDHDYDGRCALHVAASEGQLQVVELLIEMRANVNAVDRFKNTPMHDAIRSGNTAIIDMLKESGGSIGREGVAAAMCEAASSGDTRQLGLLLQTGVHVDEADYDKRTALHVAASEGNKPVVKYLLEQGATVNAKDRWQGTPLHDAVRESRPDVASLLRQAGGQLGIDAAAQAGMLCDLALDGKIEGIKALLINGGPANAADYDRRTALHVAASEGALKICELLIAQNADVNAKDRWGGTPLRDAVREGHTKVAEVLKAKGAELGMSELQASAELCEYARAGHCETIESFIKSGCPVNAADYDKRTALHLAASEGNRAVVALLLEHGADLHAKDRWQGTPLRDAEREAHKQVAELLRSKGGQ